MAHCTVIHPITCIKGGHATNQSLPSIQSPETGPDPEQSGLTRKFGGRRRNMWIIINSQSPLLSHTQHTESSS